MAWPSPSDYQDAIQNPRHCFSVPELQSAEVARTPLGLPRVASGNFASVYELRSPQGRWAVRCFLRPVSDQERRYHAISEYLNNHPLPWLVDFDYLHDGIRAAGRWYPIVKMDWVDGVPLHRQVERLLGAPVALRALADSWRGLVADLRGIGIAHGDLQHGNILVGPDGMRLVDYDGMFMPAFRGERSPELGRANYQHPARRPEDYGPELDNFSALLIYLSLRALAAEAGLWRLHDGENLILTSADFRSPGSSSAFTRLRAHPDAEVRALAARLASLCAVPVAQVPPLEACLRAASPPAAGAAATGASPSGAAGRHPGPAPSPSAAPLSPPVSPPAAAPPQSTTGAATKPAATRGRPDWLESPGPSAPAAPAPTAPQGGGAPPAQAPGAARGRPASGKPGAPAGAGPAVATAPAPSLAAGCAAMVARSCVMVVFLALLALAVLGWWGYDWWTGRVGPWAHVPGATAPASSPSSRPAARTPPVPSAPGGTPRARMPRPSAGEADLHAATALLGERRFGEASAALDRARRRGLDLTQAAVAREYYTALARVRAGRGQFREALPAFREALHRAPGDAGLLIDYGWALESLGQTGAARRAYAEALRVATSDDQRAQARAGLTRVGAG